MAGTKARTHTGLTTLVLPYATENKIHQKATTTILESLEAKLSSLERSLEKGLKLLESKISSLDTTMNKMHVELTAAVRGTFETHKAELAQTVSDTNLKAALSISKEFRNYFLNTVVIVCMLPSSIFLTTVY